MATATEEVAPAVVGETPGPEEVKEASAVEEAPKVEETPKPAAEEEKKPEEEGEGKKAAEKEKKARKPRSRKPRSAGPHHPPYFEMIKEAILAQQDGKIGCSPYAIAKHMGEKHRDVLPANYRKVLAVQLRNFAAKGRLVKVKASFKLAAAEEKKAAAAAAARKKQPAVAKRKRTAPAAKKKPAAPAEARKPRAKRARKVAPAPAPAPAQPNPKPKRHHMTIRASLPKKANKASA